MATPIRRRWWSILCLWNDSFCLNSKLPHHNELHFEWTFYHDRAGPERQGKLVSIIIVHDDRQR